MTCSAYFTNGSWTADASSSHTFDDDKPASRTTLDHRVEPAA
jgi:hypothetical protein